MSTLAQRYANLKKLVGGNREIMGYEETFGMPREEQQHITPPNKYIRRILAEIEFSINLSEANEHEYDDIIGAAIDHLAAGIAEEGVMTKTSCFEAEAILAPLAEAAKEYKLILAGHAHIDMNWMWSWHETVAATLATFRTMLNIMDEYPEFCFSQSQASVYKIVEEFEPELMDRIKARIAEGRWEITASAWVETDKNMPNTESLLRHIKYTKNYLRDSWGIDPAKLEVDFSPDTFGHSANLPEIDLNGGVKYYYHCRALDGKQALYRWRGASGKEMLVYREQYWYNSAITPKIGAGIIDISKRCAGFKTGLVVYGVGDHGGGPTRRDVERAIEMMEWPIYPRIKFGTFHEFFHEAEAVRDQLPLVDHELNFIFQGCYTTQSRIKMGNRACERALTTAETMSAWAASKVHATFNGKAFEHAWRDVLFTHFHDILTGSCVQDSREHAMGLFSNSMAVAQSQFASSMLKISEQIDTSSIEIDGDIAASQSEGAGVGFGVEGYVSGMPRSERGSGKTRIFNIFNPTPVKRSECVEITVWDWVGDLRYAKVTKPDGTPLQFQKIDGALQQYWDHKFFRFLVYVDVEALGYTTVVLSEGEMGDTYPLYYQGDTRTHGDCKNCVLENEKLRAEFNYKTGEMVSLVDKATGKEYIKAGESAGLRYVETECATSSAWRIGNYLRSHAITDSANMHTEIWGELKKGFYVEYKIKGSTVRLHVSLSKNAPALEYRAEVDWHEIGGATIPVLTYELPLAYAAEKYLYDVPAASIERAPQDQDVPALQYALAKAPDGASAGIVTESKYGYRGRPDGMLIATFINTSTGPDPYPERGIHKINFHVGLFCACPKVMEDTATALNNRMSYQPAGSHKGTLPMEGSLLSFDSTRCVISSVAMDGDALLVRVYNTTDTADSCTLTFEETVKSAASVDLMGTHLAELSASDGKISFDIPAYGVMNVKVAL
ncbi:MAG: alpha-mannosidase [Clostridia bacterium]|nr:alpha-mannosidase [Clostridia bacterium]